MTSQQERRPRVVLADDHPYVREALARMLHRSCDLVASVANGHGAIEAVCRLTPDVLVVDLMMPDLDGLEVGRRVRLASPATAVVIITAFDDTHVRAIALQDGMSAFVPKHLASRSLVQTIMRIFAENQGRSATRA